MSKSLRPLLRHGARRGLPTKAGFSRGNPQSNVAPEGAWSRRDMLRLGGLAGRFTSIPLSSRRSGHGLETGGA